MSYRVSARYGKKVLKGFHLTWQTFWIDGRLLDDPQAVLLLVRVFRIIPELVLDFSGLLRIFSGFYFVLNDSDDGAVDVGTSPDDRNLENDVVAAVARFRFRLIFANKTDYRPAMLVTKVTPYRKLT